MCYVLLCCSGVLFAPSWFDDTWSWILSILTLYNIFMLPIPAFFDPHIAFRTESQHTTQMQSMRHNIQATSIRSIPFQCSLMCMFVCVCALLFCGWCMFDQFW